MSVYEIKAINACAIGLDDYPWAVECVIEMPAKEWAKLRDSGALDALYTDISSTIRDINSAIPASFPTVADTDRAKAGLKTIRLYYYISDVDQAKKLGIRVLRLKSSGVILPGFGDVVVIHDSEKERAKKRGDAY